MMSSMPWRQKELNCSMGLTQKWERLYKKLKKALHIQSRHKNKPHNLSVQSCPTPILRVISKNPTAKWSFIQIYPKTRLRLRQLNNNGSSINKKAPQSFGEIIQTRYNIKLKSKMTNYQL